MSCSFQHDTYYSTCHAQLKNMLSSILSKLSLSPATEPSFLSNLKFESCLGHGGFGIVLKAINSNSSSQSQPPTATAVKFIFPNDPSNKEQQQILRECQLASTFTHQNVVRILNVTRKQFTVSEIEKIFKNLSQDDDRSLSLRDTCIRKARRNKTVESICIQMQLCGPNLRKWLTQEHDKNDRLVQRTQFKICFGIVAGLKYLHNQKIIHRDLKPENIMFSGEDFALPVKIGDFGLCRNLHNSETQTSTLTSRAGTREYMAPEAFSNDYSFQADLFSLGLIIWEVFQSIKFTQRRNHFYQLVNGNLSVIHEIMVGVKELIVNLTKKREDRIQSIEEVETILQGVYHTTCGQFVRNSEELVTSLKDVVSGGLLVLGEGVFNGPFILDKNDVEIVGQGCGRTKLQSKFNWACLTVEGSGCIISGVTVTSNGHGHGGIHLNGSRNTIQDVEVSGQTPLLSDCIIVLGKDNTLQNLIISNAVNGLDIHGFNNFIDQVKMKNIQNCGIRVRESQNTFRNVTGYNVQYGIWVEASRNNLSNINLVKGSEEREFKGVCLDFEGSDNNISNLTCSGYSRAKGDWGLITNSPNDTVKDSQCGPVWVRGSKSTLTNVDCGEEIYIWGDSISLTNCKGQKLIHVHPVILTDCNFDVVENE